MNRVIIASPYRGDTRTNEEYLTRALADSIHRGESPYASHAIGPRCLNDADPKQRALGQRLVEPWIALADVLAVYEDYGISPGMAAEIALAAEWGARIDYREIGRNPQPPRLGPDGCIVPKVL